MVGVVGVSFIVHLDVEAVDLSVTFSAKSHHVSIQDFDMSHLNKILIGTPEKVKHLHQIQNYEL